MMKPKNPLQLEGASPLSEKAIGALEHLDASRREFLKTAGVMMIGFGAAATTGKAQSTINPSGNVDSTQVDSWIAIAADGSITVLAGKCDFGQGLRTIQLQLAAEELSVPMSRITLVLCKTGTNGLQNQMEGQVIQGTSRALLEEVKFTNLGAGGVGGGTVTTNDWDSYTVFEFGDTIPTIDTVLINNLKVAPTGAGETIITLMPAAVGNAVYDATGVRLRQIPMTPANFLAAKAAQQV
jgi:CO/xanthine dehydrogenase Mo-binding subunit